MQKPYWPFWTYRAQLFSDKLRHCQCHVSLENKGIIVTLYQTQNTTTTKTVEVAASAAATTTTH